MAVALVALAAVQLVAEHTERAYDLTAEQSLSLTGESKRVAKQVRRPVRITAFLRRTEGGRSEGAALLDRYRRENRRISYRVLDPDDSPLVAAEAVSALVGDEALRQVLADRGRERLAVLDEQASRKDVVEDLVAVIES